MRILMLGPSDMLHVRRLVAALADRGHDVHVVSMRPDPVPGATFERYRVPSFGFRYPYGWQRRRTAIARRWFSEFDIVNVHFLADWGIDEHCGGAPLIVKAYGSDVDPPPDTDLPSAAQHAACRRLLQHADAVVTSGRRFQTAVTAFGGIYADKCTVIPNGVDMDQFRPIASAPRRAPVIGSHRGFHTPANPLTLVEAAAKVLLDRPEVKFELAGSGVQRDACVRRAESLGITHAIRWVGQRPHSELPRLISGWDIVAIAAHRESFCVSAVEAAAMEVPVVATGVGGLNETVRDGESGILVPPGDTDAFAESLVALIDDPSRRRRMGSAGRRFVCERFEWRRSVDAWTALFEHHATNRSPVAELAGV